MSLDMNRRFFKLALGSTWTRILAQNLVRAFALNSCLLAFSSAFGQQVIPMQPIRLQSFLATEAARDCDNSIVAAALESILNYENVAETQGYWIDKLFFGRTCSTSPVDYEKLASAINNNWVLDNGRKISIQTRYIKGPEISADSVILQLNAKHPMILVWKNHPYLIYGAVYDKIVDPNTAGIQYVIRRLDLMDNAKKPDQNVLSFDRPRDNPAEINGIMLLDVNTMRRSVT